jgi:hypothetical protein
MSASLNRRSEDVRIHAVIVAELKLSDIEAHVLPAHTMERANDTALEDTQNPSIAHNSLYAVGRNRFITPPIRKSVGWWPPIR